MTSFGLLVGCGIVLLFLVVVLWVNGIDYMQKNHPDYKGEDFFNEEDDKEEIM